MSEPADYWTNCGGQGPVRRGELPGAIGVYGDLRPGSFPIGIAFGARWTDDGLQLWRLVVGKVEVPGRFILRAGPFERLEPGEDG